MGIPLLHPWANRLGERRFEVAGARSTSTPPSRLRAPTPRACRSTGCWRRRAAGRSCATSDGGDGGVIEAAFDFTAQPGLIDAFPFPHTLLLEASLEGSTLTIAVTVAAAGSVPVPVSFGFHPYLRLPGVERSEWRVEVPVGAAAACSTTGCCRAASARRCGSTPGRSAIAPSTTPSTRPPAGRAFVLSGGGRRIELALGAGYPYSQVYAPDDDEVVAFEPMTAPDQRARHRRRRPAADRAGGGLRRRSSRSPSATPEPATRSQPK